MAKVRCSTCKTYIDRDSALRIGISSYCDNDCLVAKKSKSTPTKRTRKNKSPKQPVSDELAEWIFKRDSYRCRLCGKGSTNLAIHHILYRSEILNRPWMNEPWNLISLHNRPCHLDVVHGNKKRYQRLCLGITWLAEVHGDRTTTIHQLEEQHET